jgi:hypothetical protein
MSEIADEFNESLFLMTDEQLFRAFHNIQSAREYAETGEGSDARETLFLKERRVQAEMRRRHPRETMCAYDKWLAHRMFLATVA